MEVIILENADSVAEKGAELVSGMLRVKSDSVFGFATGRTPISMYHCLVNACQQGQISFRDAVSFNLDEYLGIPAEHPQSYRTFMNRQFFDKVDIPLANTHLPACAAGENPRLVGARYEAMIAAAGGIDLQVLGIGHNGHIGFNEPGSSLRSRTRVKTLTDKTLEANSQLFGVDERQPKLAITMGIATIMDARRILLLATGSAKATAISEMVEGPISASCPASMLQMHEHVTVLLDPGAAGKLRNTAYYQLAYQENEALKQRFSAFYEK